MTAKISLRRADDNDYRRFYQKEPPSGWVGFVADRDEEIVAFGYVWIDDQGRAWTGIDDAKAVPPLMLHRAIADFFMALGQEGIAEIYALCDERIGNAAKWLTRLGFAIDENIPKVYLKEEDKFIPVWRRPLGGMAS